jgi:hypothetical protein
VGGREGGRKGKQASNVKRTSADNGGRKETKRGREGGRVGGRADGHLGGSSVVADTDNGDFGEFDEANELLHSSSILPAHPVHLVHDDEALRVGGGGGEGAGGGESRVV